MMSVSPGMGAGQAGRYFSREDYYLRGDQTGGNSQWLGKGARELGLDGPVGEEEFRALCRGQDPSGELIVAPKLTRDRERGTLIEMHRAGNDCTFSAPKSVSIAYAAGVEGIKEAHDKAVTLVLDHMEEHYCHYRSPDGILNGRMVAAKFDHATSRNIDPQLHSHVFALNVVHAQDGSWKANEPRAIFQNQKSLGLLYRQALAQELAERGFEVAILDRSQMFIELKGVDPLLLGHFSSRRKAIENQVGLWRDEGRFSEVSHARLYEMAALESRDPKREITREDVTRIFGRGFELCGSSVEEVKRDLEMKRDLALSREAPERGSDSPARTVELAARDLTDREAVLDRARLLDQAVRISGGRHKVRELDLAIDGGAQSVLRIGQDLKGREFYTTSEMVDLERRNLARIRELPPFQGVAREREVRGFLEQLEGEGIRLTAGQRREVLNELAGSRSVALTLGDPGTAKTSTLQIVERFNEEVLRPQGLEHFTINMAYTGKAARELSLATGRPAFTIDSLINAYTASKFDLQREKGELSILEVSGEKILIPERSPVVLRVDEASLLGAREADHLLGMVENLQERGRQVKLHLLGDSKQMQAIQAGDLLRQVQELGGREEVDYVHMTEILRQREPGLLEIARGLNREDRPLGVNAREALISLEQQGRVTEIADRYELVAAARDRYLAESRELSNVPERAAAGERQRVLLVTTTNAERKELNREIRLARVAAGEIQEGMSFPVLAPARQEITVEGYRPGDAVIFSGWRREDGRMQAWGARLGTEGKVIGLDRERNTVEISYSFQTRKRDGRKLSRTVTREYSAAELAGRCALYREEERQFAVGDRIVALKNDAGLDLQNGSLGVIKALDERGWATVDLGDREVALDLTRYRQIDHAYAVTIHKSQGATVEHSIMFAQVRPEPEHARETGTERSLIDEPYGRASYNALNVAVTRAQFDAHVFTNSVKELTRSVELVDEKTSTLSRIPGEEREVSRMVPGRGMDLAEPRHGLEEQLRKLERSVRSPGEGLRRLNLENILVRSMTAQERALLRPLREIPVVQKEMSRELERVHPKKIELELEI
jgi:conjugative relaxase-like TrwC/TraI family protein